MKIEFYPEICCDECKKVVHNHMDCPACNYQYAPTNQFYDMDYSLGFEIKCEHCYVKFRVIKEAHISSDTEWEQIPC
jgi:hypothetical protein